MVSEEQLACYDSVRRASASLRRMSTNNNTPLLDSRSGSMSLVRADHRRRGVRPRDSCHSAPGTLQRWVTAGSKVVVVVVVMVMVVVMMMMVMVMMVVVVVVMGVVVVVVVMVMVMVMMIKKKLDCEFLKYFL